MLIARSISLVTAMLLVVQPAARLAICDCQSSDRPAPRPARADCFGGRAATDCAACQSPSDACCTQTVSPGVCPCCPGVCICISRSSADDSALPPPASQPRTVVEQSAATVLDIAVTLPNEENQLAANTSAGETFVIIPLQLCSELCRWRL